jgi:hypothetical protein
MQQFKALACTNKNNLISLPLLCAYLDEHDLPSEIGKFSLPSLLAHKSIVEDAAHPGY